MFNIQDFSTNLNNSGVIQSNKFVVSIAPPRILITALNVSQLIQFRGRDVRVPGVALDLTQVSRYGVGPLQRFPSNINFTDTVITFVDDANTTLWKFFSAWMNGIFDFSGGNGLLAPSYRTEYKSNYSTDVRVVIFDNSGNAACTVVLKEAFPTILNDNSLSWGDNNTLLTVTATFAFTEWYLESNNLGINYIPSLSATPKTVFSNPFVNPPTIESIPNPPAILPASMPYMMPLGTRNNPAIFPQLLPLLPLKK